MYSNFDTKNIKYVDIEIVIIKNKKKDSSQELSKQTKNKKK